MYGAYRCKVCGETHLGSGKPGECRFCGAGGELLKAVDPSEVEFMQLDHTGDERLDLADPITDLKEFKPQVQLNGNLSAGLDKASKIEPTNGISEKLKESLRKEEDIMKAYTRFVENASEEEMEKFFKALEDVEEVI